MGQDVQRLAAGADGRDVDVIVQQQIDDAASLDVVILHDEKPLAVRRQIRLDSVQPSMSGKNASSVMAVGWYWRASDRAAWPRFATSPLNPLSRARPSKIRA